MRCSARLKCRMALSSATPACLPSVASSFASAFISATWSRKATAISWATASYRRAAEGVCEAGAICLSEDAYRQVSGRLDAWRSPTSARPSAQEHRKADPGSAPRCKWACPPRTKPVMPAKPPRPRGHLRLALVAAGIAALIAIGTGAWHFLDASRSAAVAAPAVAILPFDNLGGDEQASRLADGMTEDVITDLARYKDLLVIARNSTLAYKGKPVDARQVAKDLNVRYVLAGSIQHQADQLRVTAELIDAGSGAAAGGPRRWDRPAQDMFSVQAEIADKVAASLWQQWRLKPRGDPRAFSCLRQKKRAPANAFRLRFMVARHETIGLAQ